RRQRRRRGVDAQRTGATPRALDRERPHPAADVHDREAVERRQEREDVRDALPRKPRAPRVAIGKVRVVRVVVVLRDVVRRGPRAAAHPPPPPRRPATAPPSATPSSRTSVASEATADARSTSDRYSSRTSCVPAGTGTARNVKSARTTGA